MGPKTISFAEEDRAIVTKLNNLLEQLNVSSRLKTIADIGAGVFVTLFEGLCGEQLPGIIRAPSTREDEIHNCQLVIDSLAGDVLHTSLTHISGADIIDGGREAIMNLAEIFAGLLEYMLNKIDSDASTDNEDDREADLTQDDPDALTPDTIDRILESELRKERLLQETEAIKKGGPAAVWEEVSPSKRLPAVVEPSTTRDLINLGRDTTLSPTKGARDTTADLIRESEVIEQRLKDQRSQPRPILEEPRARFEEPKPRFKEPEQKLEEPKPSDDLRTNGRKSPESVPQRTEGIIRDRSARDEVIRRLENDPRYKSLLPPTKTHDMNRREAGEPADKDDDTFTTLRNMVEETAELARAAVGASPSRAKSILETLESGQAQRRPFISTSRGGTSPYKGRSPVRGTVSTTPVRSRRDKAEQQGRAGSAKRASPSARRPSPKAADRLSDTELTPSKAKRKVSFLVDRSLTDSSPSIEKSSPLRQSPLKVGARGRTARSDGSYLSFDMYGDKENTSYENLLKKQYEEIVADVLSDDESPSRPTSDYRQKKSTAFSGRPKAFYTVGETRKIVRDEKEAGRRKMGFLQKIYREDLDELIDEADYEMYKNRKAAKETEAEYKKKVLTGIKPSQTVDSKTPAPSVLKKKTRKAAPFVSSKVKKTSPPKTSVILQKPKRLTIKDDDDILPLLLEEFPHLHLSLHTWHELWRKGLQQIEQITHAHQEVRRKKTRAQAQLEEAEQRQEIMVNIMKKELEHSQRLKEIKDRNATAISTRNRLHERRMQSARSRHYYDEYQVRMRSKMMKRRTREEMIFKKLFRDGLDIQKERIKELRKYAREQRNSQAKVQRDEIESMENYYRDQFEMLAESIAREKKELMIREKAQQKVMGEMKKDIRKKMETEIKHLQEHLVHDDDDAYFRQLDADRVVQDLQMAKYKVRI